MRTALPRGSFDISNNYVVGWNDPGDWCIAAFPEPAKSYNVIGRLSSGGNPIIAELGDVTGATTANQTVTKLGNFKPGRATAGWDNMEWFQMTDDAGNAASVSLGGEKTLRFTVLPGANLDVDTSCSCRRWCSSRTELDDNACWRGVDHLCRNTARLRFGDGAIYRRGWRH
jgi:hypothetical protein